MVGHMYYGRSHDRVVCWRIHPGLSANRTALYLEGAMQANRNNEDAPGEHQEITDAEQSKPRLVC